MGLEKTALDGIGELRYRRGACIMTTDLWEYTYMQSSQSPITPRRVTLHIIKDMETIASETLDLEALANS